MKNRHKGSIIKLINVRNGIAFHFDISHSTNAQFKKVEKCRNLNKNADKCKQQRYEYCSKYDYRHIPADCRAAGVEFKLLIDPLNCFATILADNLGHLAAITAQVNVNPCPAMWAFQAEPVMSVSGSQWHMIL